MKGAPMHLFPPSMFSFTSSNDDYVGNTWFFTVYLVFFVQIIASKVKRNLLCHLPNLLYKHRPEENFPKVLYWHFCSSSVRFSRRHKRWLAWLAMQDLSQLFRLKGVYHNMIGYHNALVEAGELSLCFRCSISGSSFQCWWKRKWKIF